MDEQQLINQFKTGDLRTDEIIFEKFYQMLCYFTERLINHREDGQDIVLDAFHKLFQKRNNFENLKNIQAFLYIACKNSSLNYLRSKDRHRKREKDFMALQKDQFFELEITEAKFIERVHQAVESLPTQCRQVVKLYYFEDRKYPEIAAMLGIAENTARSQKRRGIQLLKELLGPSEAMLFIFLANSGFFACMASQSLLIKI